ncbi:MAG TPA: Zn-ribbon domain-containing OB-fold protein [Quisquiliibacterium sp.]|jgi:uncharacterized OB-fold protein|nr:Zn-ribbon domain-containing OB-fold protein [Quisquiliibacterium sp.]
MTTPERPPKPPIAVGNADTAPFWSGTARGELLYQRCRACGRTQFPPRRHCAHCQAGEPDWEISAGQGSVHSFTVVHRAPTAAFKDDVPYTIALVDLDEGFRMMLNVLDSPPAELAIGSRVRIVYRPHGEAMLPQAELAT